MRCSAVKVMLRRACHQEGLMERAAGPAAFSPRTPGPARVQGRARHKHCWPRFDRKAARQGARAPDSIISRYRSLPSRVRSPTPANTEKPPAGRSVGPIVFNCGVPRRGRETRHWRAQARQRQGRLPRPPTAGVQIHTFWPRSLDVCCPSCAALRKQKETRGAQRFRPQSTTMCCKPCTGLRR